MFWVFVYEREKKVQFREQTKWTVEWKTEKQKAEREVNQPSN
jgi:hypothetical protein